MFGQHAKGTAGRSPSGEKRRLRNAVLLFFVCLAVPLSYLLWRAYSHLEDEIFYQRRADAELVMSNIDQQIDRFLAPEERRPFDEYGFLSVSTNTLVPKPAVRFSPLAELPPKTEFPGVIGYFQINPDGSFHTPFLPDTEEALLRPDTVGVSAEELQRRVRTHRLLEDAVRVPRTSAPGEAVASRFRDRQSDKEEWVFGRSSALEAPMRKLSARPAAEPERQVHEQQLAELNIDARQYNRNEKFEILKEKKLAQEPLAKSRASRKTTSWAADDQQLSALGAGAPPAAQESAALPSTPAITTFEAEIDPFQFMPLEGGRYAFFRKVWRDGRRYIQGFVVDEQPLFEMLFREPLLNSPLADGGAIVVGYNGGVLVQLGSRGGAAADRGLLLLRKNPTPPMNSLELLFTIDELPPAPGAALIDATSVALILIVALGLIVIYKLGAQQIDLAAKKGDFVSAVTHELKTPLTSIRMYAEILKSGWTKDDEQRRFYYDFIFNESERLSRLIANVLHLSRLTNGHERLQLYSDHPSRLLTSLSAKINAQVEAGGFHLEQSDPGAPEHVTVAVDEDALSRIVINLVDNALKFSKHAERKVINFGYRLPPRNKVEFFVRDFGPGVDPAQQKKIFQLFYRVESELVRTTPGTGIGLALVKELANEMNATVDLERCSPGCEFRIRFNAIDKRDAIATQ